MCFRPTSVSKPVDCPKCGKTNLANSKVCRFCGAELSGEKKSAGQ